MASISVAAYCALIYFSSAKTTAM